MSDLNAVAAFFTVRPAFHILVDSAGTNRPKPMTEVNEADYDAVLDLNVESASFVAHACVTRMLAEGAAGKPDPHGIADGPCRRTSRSLYCASKRVLEGMSKAFAHPP